ncbi:hypothetical protein JD969_04180 [Planctomycetota bacterium]|nr:hypothetical protein JD969_04180 [Planctomycetota bacterium]
MKRALPIFLIAITLLSAACVTSQPHPVDTSQTSAKEIWPKAENTKPILGRPGRQVGYARSLMTGNNQYRGEGELRGQIIFLNDQKFQLNLLFTKSRNFDSNTFSFSAHGSWDATDENNLTLGGEQNFDGNISDFSANAIIQQKSPNLTYFWLTIPGDHSNVMTFELQ